MQISSRQRALTLLGLLIAAELIVCQFAKPQRDLVFVSNERSNDVSVIDAHSASVLTTLHVGKRPRGMRISPDGQYLLVAVSGSPPSPPGARGQPSVPDRNADGVAVVDIATLRNVRVLAGGNDPESFDVSPDGRRLFVSNEDSGRLSVVDVDSGVVLHQVPVGGEPEGVAVRPDGAVVYVTSELDDHVTAIATGDYRVLATIQTAARPRSIVFDADGARAYVTCENGAAVTVIDAHQHSAIQDIRFPDASARPMGAALTHDGSKLLVTTGRGRTLSVIDLARREIAHSIGDVGVRPWGLAVAPDDGTIYVANGPSNDVSVIDAHSLKIRKRIPTGASPWGVAFASIH